MRRVATAGIAATMLAGLAGCKLPADTGAGGNPDARYEAVSFKALPGWSPARAEAGLAAFVRSCKVIEVMPIDQALGGAGIAARRAGRAGDWRAACAAARAVPPADPQAAEAFFEKTFQPYAAAGSTHFTGYYEPVYPASKTRRRGYEVPLYGMPSDLVTASPAVFGGGGKAAGTSATSKHHAGKQVVGRIVYGKLVPYYTRAEIADGALGRDAPVIAWLRSPAARYMLQIQGSGQLDLRHGKHITVGFAGTNGRPYTPIGRVMVQQGDLREDDVNAGTIAGYLRAHPKRARVLMDANENFVFFKRVVDVPEGLGAPGALGVPLTGGHALAVDWAAIPLGAPVYLAAGDARHAAGFDRLAVAQDLDVAAHGTGAAQLFTGLGPGGERRAAATDFDGRLYLLLPRPQPVASDAAKGGVS